MTNLPPDTWPSYDSELLDAPGFSEWAFAEGSMAAKTWQLRYDADPSLASRMDQARATLITLGMPRYQLSATERKEMRFGLQFYMRSRRRIARRLPQRQRAGVWHAAAVIALLVGLGYWWQSNQLVVVETASAEMRTVCLPDDSQVLMNGNSRIEYARDWGKNEDRSVTLFGEAYFHVQARSSDDGRQVKFTVNASTIRIEVLGTQFSVSAGKQQARVVLREGRVRVHPLAAPEAAVHLSRGEAIEYGSMQPNGSATSRKVDISQELSWLEGRWMLQNEPLSAFAVRMQQQFGVRLTWQDPRLDTLRLSGSLPTQDIHQLREGLAAALGRDIQLSGQTMVIQSLSSNR